MSRTQPSIANGQPGGPGRAHLLLLSPHPDDIAWSLGGTLAQLRGAGAHVRVLTFFTRSQYAPGRSGLDVAAVSALRAAEERAWAADAGVELIRGDLADAGLRGFDDDTELGAAPEPEIVQAASALLSDALAAHEPDAVFVPGRHEGHVDHTAVRIAAEAQAHPAPLLYFDDLPYAAAGPASTARYRFVVRIQDHWSAKERGMRHFASQAWPEVLPLARQYAERVGGEPISTASRSGADLLRRLTREVSE